MITHQCETAGGTAATSPGTARWLSLAATPTFAVMAVLAGFAGDTADILCPATHGASPLTGMVAMYLLMSVFHSGPWLKLISREHSRARQS